MRDLGLAEATVDNPMRHLRISILVYLVGPGAPPSPAMRPETNEGRKELVARAKASEEARDRALAMDNMYDVASAALQLIVLASASAAVGVAWLAWAAGGLGILGFVFAILGWFAPTLIPI